MLLFMKRLIIIFYLFLISFNIFAQSEGEKLFMNNKPAQAAIIFEKDIESGTNDSNTYNYLGLCYYQLQEYEKSVETFEKGLTAPGTNKKILAFNAGNSCYAMKDFKKAVEYYGLAYKLDQYYSQALLNEANSHLMLSEYDKALEDYEHFLVLEPNDRQEPNIRLMIELLRKEVARLEEERILAEAEAARIAEEERLYKEELKRKEEERLAQERERLRLEAERLAEEERLAQERRAEEERIAAEKKAEEERLERERLAEIERLAEEKRKADAERRRKLLEEVASSLQNTESTNMSSGAEDIIDYDQESELD